jgi:CBS domain-containing protein
VLKSIGAGQDVDAERVAEHLTADLVFASPDWSLEEAAIAMVKGRFRHLIVVEHGDVTGVLSVRDIIRCWSQEGATSEMPSSTPAGHASA